MVKKDRRPPPALHDNHSLSITVGIGEYRTAGSPCLLRTVLGSCVGVMIYDAVAKIGGLAHIYLPFSKDFKKSTYLLKNDRRLSFADILIPRMLQELESKQGDRSRFEVHIAGGGYILPAGGHPRLDIGKKNIEAVREVLALEKIKARELILGQKKGQSVIFNLSDGGIEIKLLG